MKNILVASIIIDRITEVVKMKTNEKYHKYINGLTISLVLGVITAVGFDLDIMGELGMISKIPYLGHVFTGALFAGGSAIINATLEAIQGLGELLLNKGAQIEEVL